MCTIDIPTGLESWLEGWETPSGVSTRKYKDKLTILFMPRNKNNI